MPPTRPATKKSPYPSPAPPKDADCSWGRPGAGAAVTSTVFAGCSRFVNTRYASTAAIA
jgi:hypothetical protein